MSINVKFLIIQLNLLIIGSINASSVNAMNNNTIVNALPNNDQVINHKKTFKQQKEFINSFLDDFNIYWPFKITSEGLEQEKEQIKIIKLLPHVINKNKIIYDGEYINFSTYMFSLKEKLSDRLYKVAKSKKKQFKKLEDIKQFGELLNMEFNNRPGNLLAHFNQLGI